ncbi:hypothetical protein MPSEU_000404700 [Mayamaea pseudoterrestris]|nr:hypothetical protein MPSEU_000404700 [Mayamaea pseudoterrestris]
MTDIDAVNERLNNLVSLLQAVGISDVSKDDMARVSQSLTNGSQLNEAQIEQLIRKLQGANGSAPQVIAALEAHAHSGNNGRSAATSSSSNRHARAAPPPPPEPEEEEEDSDSFDEDADYPMVGHGVSDDMSVMSDLTTPTVVSSLHIPEEEHYREGSLPPMMIGGDGNLPSMMIAPPKRKNLVQPQRAGALAPPPARRPTSRPDRGGAASARLKNYQTTMAKLSDPVPKKSGVKKSSTAAAANSATSPNVSAPKKKAAPKKKTDENFSDLAASRGGNDVGNNGGWGSAPATANQKSPRQAPKKKVSSGGAGKTPIDDDGFLVGDGFDPFDTAANPFKSSAGDLEFGMASSDPFRADFDAFGSFNMSQPARPSQAGPAAAAKPRVKKPVAAQAATAAAPGLQRKAPATAKNVEGRPRRARRASAIS